MTIAELIKELTDNLTLEQKDMEALFLDSNGETYEITAMFVITKMSNDAMPEGQTVLASFGTVNE